MYMLKGAFAILAASAVAGAHPLSDTSKRDDNPLLSLGQSMPPVDMPPVEKRDDNNHIVNFKEACKDHKPPANHCSLVTAGGTTIEWSGPNLGNGNADKAAALLNDDCSAVLVKEWEPQSPRFKVEFEIDGNTVEAKTGYIGSDQVTAPEYIKINGKEMKVDCGGEESMSGGTWGIEHGYYRTCWFDCRYSSFE